MNMEENELKQDEKCEKCEEYLAGWKRAQADYANLKKDTEREKNEFSKYANEKMLLEIFPLFDLLRIAKQHIPELQSLNEEDKIKFINWLNGLNAINDLKDSFCKIIGLEEIQPEGQMFDPNLHDVLMTASLAGAPMPIPGTVTSTINSGWRLNGKLIKHARVTIQPE